MKNRTAQPAYDSRLNSPTKTCTKSLKRFLSIIAYTAPPANRMAKASQFKRMTSDNIDPRTPVRIQPIMIIRGNAGI